MRLLALGLDLIGNNAQLPEGGLSANVIGPDGSDTSTGLKPGRAATYELRHETMLSGEYAVHVLLHGGRLNYSLHAWCGGGCWNRERCVSKTK